MLNLDSAVTLAAALKSVFALLESCKSDAKSVGGFGSFILVLRGMNSSLLLSSLEVLSFVLVAGENICASERILGDLFVLFEGLGIDCTLMSYICIC